MARPKKRSHQLRPDEITRLRTLRGLTEEQLAERAGIHPRTLTRKLAGEVAYLSTAQRLAEALGVECAAILADPENAGGAGGQAKEAKVLPGRVRYQNNHKTLLISVPITGPEGTTEQQRQRRLLADFLATLLPDNADITAGAEGDANVVRVEMSVDNLMALGTLTARLGLADLGVEQALLAYGEIGAYSARAPRPNNAAGEERSEHWRPLLPSEVEILHEWGWQFMQSQDTDGEPDKQPSPEMRRRAARAAIRKADFDDLAALMPAGRAGMYSPGDKDFYYFPVDSQAQLAVSYLGSLIAEMRGESAG